MAIDIQEEYTTSINRDGAIKFVGSSNKKDFDSMGHEHFNYLQFHKLKPHHVFFDVGCGALRTGQYVIPYLNPGNYYGLDRMPELIEYGLNEVLTPDIVFHNKPKFSVNNEFNCNFIDKQVDYVWCQSLMSHLSTADIKDCLNKISEKLSPSGRIFFTYFQMEGLKESVSDAQKSHSKEDLFYSEEYMDKIVASCNLKKIYNNPVGHPRGQWMYICRK